MQFVFQEKTQNDFKNLKNDWKADTLVLICEYSVRAIQLIPTWQGLDEGLALQGFNISVNFRDKDKETKCRVLLVSWARLPVRMLSVRIV